MQRSKQQIARVVDELAYDFSGFSIQAFVEHIADIRQREIKVIQRTLPPSVTGVWVPRPALDFIFYTSGTHSIHQTHIVLHELAHMLLEHPHQQIYLRSLFGNSFPDKPIFAHVRSADTYVNLDHEWEAEQFVFETRQRIQRAHRMTELVKPLSSNEKLAEVSMALFFDEMR